ARSQELDARRGVDTTAIAELRERMTRYERENARIASLRDLVVIVAVGLGFTGLSHFLAEPLAAWIEAEAPLLAIYSLTSAFFWLVVLATTFGLLASFTSLRRLENAGASKVGSVLLYVLIATIGMQMDIGAVFSSPG